MKTVSILGLSSEAAADVARVGLPVAQMPGRLPEELRGRVGELAALYIHVPFCSTKCHYCDFYSLAGHLDRADAYLRALENEARLHERFFGRAQPRTIFIGGGTPTLLSAEQLKQLLDIFCEHVDMGGLEEFTVEANPNTFDAARAKVLKAGGVNRMSFGAQSFHLAELRMLQRDHDPESVAEAFAIARDVGIDNLNVDLIFGIPGQTVESWEVSLARALELEPSHMSCYSLIYEPQTAMTARLARGEFGRIDEETELAMFEHVYRRLRGSGFVRYETSNYARPGRECRHNLAYWKAANWLGWGPSAGSHLALPESSGYGVAWQWKNAGSLAHYLSTLDCPEPRVPVSGLEGLSRKAWAGAAAVFWLRLAEGLSFSEFQGRTGVDARPVLERVLGAYVESGHAEILDDAARITESGVAVSNHILSRVLAAFQA